MVFINREMPDYGKARGSDELGDSPGKSVLAITLGALIIVPPILSAINTFRRVQTAQRLAVQEQLHGSVVRRYSPLTRALRAVNLDPGAVEVLRAGQPLWPRWPSSKWSRMKASPTPSSNPTIPPSSSLRSGRGWAGLVGMVAGTRVNAR